MPSPSIPHPHRTRRARPRPSPLLLALCGLCLLIAPARAAAPADLARDVAQNVRKVLATAGPKRATVAVQVVALGEAAPRVLFAQHADRPMIPASNLKLLTTAAALDALGKDFTFRTQLLVRRDPSTGEIELAVIGDGDPSFGDAALLRGIEGWGTRTVFDTWAGLLRQEGIARVARLLVDDSVFDDQYIHDDWPLNQRHLWYEAQVGGLNLNINCLDVYLSRSGGRLMSYRLDPPTAYVDIRNDCKQGSKNAVAVTRAEGGNAILLYGETNAREQGPVQVTIDNPTAYFGTVLSETLREAGIECDPEPEPDRTIRKAWEQQQRGERSTGEEDGQWRLLAVHETGLAPVLSRTNKDSINLYAECLAKRAAFAATGEPGSWEAAAEVARAYLARIGAEAGHVTLADGSGMSRQNRVTAAALCDVLAAQHRGDAAELFRDSLSQAGADGTLQRRFRTADRSDLHGRVYGKTGYINGVSTFSGYLHGRDGAWYAFSILVNGPQSEIGTAKVLQEEIILAVDRSLPSKPPSTKSEAN